MKKTLILLAVLLFISIAVLFVWNSKKGGAEIESGYKVVTRDNYSFQIPSDWIAVDPRDVEGCRWDGAVNDGGDGHRQNGEVGIYQKSCFDLVNAAGKKEITEKYGHYIIAYYDRDTGTTAEEEAETKSVYQKIVSTFEVN